MNRRTLLAGFAVGLSGCASDGESAVSEVLSSEIDTDAAEAAILEGINAERRDRNVNDLQHAPELQTAAREHSQDMADRDFFDHTNPDGEGPEHRVGCHAGENIYHGDRGRIQNAEDGETWQATNADGVAGATIEGWTISQAHYELMIDALWRRAGVGVVVADDEFFVTAKFC